MEFSAFRQFLEERRNQIAGVIIEPLIQMAAGFRFHSIESLATIEKICHEFDLIFIADEVATGFGRTGTMFALEQAGLKPDIVCVGKGLTGGTLGLAATIATNAVYQPFHSESWDNAFMHGPTYMGNPIACAAANASLDLFEQEPRLAQVHSLEALLEDQFERMKQKSCVADVRCKGAVGVVQLTTEVPVQSAIDFFVDRGCWLRPLRDTIYVAPSFTMKQEQVVTLTEAINDYLETI